MNFVGFWVEFFFVLWNGCEFVFEVVDKDVVDVFGCFWSVLDLKCLGYCNV